MANPNLPIQYPKNVYVGARYVPKFADPVEWSADATYEPLTIVTYQGNSYTSRTFVPAGVLPTDELYWAATGNYNAQVEAYRQEVLNYTQKLDSKLSGLQRKLVFPKTVHDTDPEGSCGFLICSDGKSAILFDVGKSDNYTEILNCLKNYGIEKIQAVVISHYHEDHAGNVELMRQFNTSNMTLYLPLKATRFPSESSTLDSFLQTYPNAKVVYPTEGSSFIEDDYRLLFYNCGATTIGYWDSTSEPYNNYSMVCFVSFKKTTMFFTGDIEKPAEDRLFSSGSYMQAQFCTAPHHTVVANGNRELAMMIGSSFVYANDSYNIGRWFGSRDPFIATFGIYGAHIYYNSVNASDTEFTFNDAGVMSCNGVPMPINGNHNANHVYYNVDFNSTASFQNGTPQYPFLSVSQALANVPPGYQATINVLADNLNEWTITGVHDCELVIIGGITIPTISISNCGNLTIRGGSLVGYNAGAITANNVDTLVINQMTCPTLNLTNTNFITGNITLTGTRTGGLIVIAKCNAQISGINCTSTAETLVRSINSILAIDFSLGSIPNITTPLSVDVASIVRSGFVGGTSTLIKVVPNNGLPYLVYDNQVNKFGIVRNRNISYLQMEPVSG